MRESQFTREKHVDAIIMAIAQSFSPEHRAHIEDWICAVYDEGYKQAIRDSSDISDSWGRAIVHSISFGKEGVTVFYEPSEKMKKTLK